MRHFESPKHVLLVGEAHPLFRVARSHLERSGFQVSSAQSLSASAQRISETLPDCIVVCLSPSDPIEALHDLRNVTKAPMIVIASQDNEQVCEREALQALFLGADNYIRQPVNWREFVARIKALIRRVEALPLPPKILRVDDHLYIDFSRRQIISGEKTIKLSPLEWRFLYHLVAHMGHTLSSKEILSRVWGWESQNEIDKLRQLVCSLRQKIEPDPEQPRYILTDRGIGYQFAPIETHRLTDRGVGYQFAPIETHGSKEGTKEMSEMALSNAKQGMHL